MSPEQLVEAWALHDAVWNFPWRTWQTEITSLAYTSFTGSFCVNNRSIFSKLTKLSPILGYKLQLSSIINSIVYIDLRFTDNSEDVRCVFPLHYGRNLESNETWDLGTRQILAPKQGTGHLLSLAQWLLNFESFLQDDGRCYWIWWKPIYFAT